MSHAWSPSLFLAAGPAWTELPDSDLRYCVVIADAELMVP